MDEMSEDCKTAFKEFLKAQKHEMEVHKWLESEKAGHDLGNAAVQDWIDKHAKEFREKWDEDHPSR